jgi:hypothetical protein
MKRILYQISTLNNFIDAHSFKQTQILLKETETKFRAFIPQANYTDRATASCRRS